MWCGRNCGDALCLCGQRAAAAIVGFRGGGARFVAGEWRIISVVFGWRCMYVGV